ncbi:hypothetical protein HZH68_008403 [Vespula germanica]|uniref:Uncharacterized protein n=1 Tax=Vespula germanica TaxID=30212 RepID=A0A834K9J8_VESGE|nr:hypothetical protein HZH68_008403 [Vespula germanica]
MIGNEWREEEWPGTYKLNRSFKRVNLAARDREHEKVRPLPVAIANGDDDDDDYDGDSRAGDRNSLIADNLMILPDNI